MSQTADALLPLLKAARFSKLYWIDDKFAPSPEKLIPVIVGKIQSFWDSHANPDARLEHPGLRMLTRNQSNQFLERHVGEMLSALDDLKKAEEIIQTLDDQIRRADPAYSNDVRDLSASQFGAIKKAFEDCGVATHTMGYSDWNLNWNTIKKSCDTESLFLVDYNFEGEAGCDNRTGEEVLKVLVNTNKSFSCILLTHESTKEGETTYRNEVCQRIKTKKAYRFAVVSKEHLTEKAAQGGYGPIANALRDAFVREWCHAVAVHSKKVIRRAHDKTDALLMDMRLDEIATCLFRKPHDDGTIELDVLLRLFSLAGRIGLQDDYHLAPLWAPLCRIRRVMNAPPPPTSNALISKKLRLYRDREVFDPAAVVNNLCSPPYLGDVFAVKASSPSYYMLLAQPCDLIIRGEKGERKSSEALFVPIKSDPPTDFSFGYQFAFPDISPTWIWFNKAVAVNLYVLDMVSFNAEGKACIDSSFVEKDTMLPGVAIKFAKAKQQLSSIAADANNFKNGKFIGSLARISRLISHDQMKGVSPVVTPARIEYDIRRVGRVRSPYAETILGRFAMYHTRTAFDFDFSDMGDYQTEPADNWNI